MPELHRRLLSSCFAVVLLAGCAGPEQATVVSRPPAPTVSPAPPDRPVPHEVTPPPAYRQAIAANTRTADGRPGGAYWIQDATYRLHAQIDPTARQLIGSAEIEYTNHSPDRLDRLYLELVQNFHAEGAVRIEFAEVTGGMELSRVAVAGADLPPLDLVDPEQPFYNVEGTSLVIQPESGLEAGASVTLQIDWSFTIPQKGAGARMGLDRENLIFGAYWYPVMAVYDDVEGWNTEQFMGRSEFYSGFGDYEVEIRLPAGWLVMSTGTLSNPEEVLADDVLARMREAHQSDLPLEVVGPEQLDSATKSSTDGLLTWRFRADDVRDVAFSATRESIWEAARTPVGDLDGDGQVDYTQINTFYRETAPLWSEVTAYQQHAITFLSEHMGYPYPWPHMTAVESGGIIQGGMEYPMMTLMGDYNERGDSALYYVTAHELGHMWVPMIVNTNERQFSWMDEGITTFNENAARMDYFPGRNHHLGDQNLYLSLANREDEGSMMQHSGFHHTATAFGIASYMKPATLLVALREVLGEDVFYRAFRAFIDDWAHKHAYPWDFFNTFERVSGRDLDWFWRSWYYETWTLDQAVEAVTQENDRATVVIRDEGLAPMPVLLEITLENGEVVDRRIPVDVWLTGDTTTSISLSTDSPIARVEIDPRYAFPDIDRSNNVWTASVGGSR